jgi:hypothetical protein
MMATRTASRRDGDVTCPDAPRATTYHLRVPGSVDQLRARIPPRWEPTVRSAYRRATRLAARAGIRRRMPPVRWGSLRRLTPVSRQYGFDRGTPVDRRLIDAFFAEHARDIRGHVLEVKDPGFTERFGTGVTAVDILDINPHNDRATVIADVADPGSLPAGRFDCAIVPQTLQYVRDIDASLRNLWESLAPGGVLLVSVPVVSKLDHDLVDVDRWRVTAAGLTTAIEAACPGAELTVSARGNVLLAVAFLMGVSAEELRDREIEADDATFPIVSFARARKPA